MKQKLLKSLMNYDTYTHIKRRSTSNSESQHSNGVHEVEDVSPFLHFSVLVGRSHCTSGAEPQHIQPIITWFSH